MTQEPHTRRPGVYRLSPTGFRWVVADEDQEIHATGEAATEAEAWAAAREWITSRGITPAVELLPEDALLFYQRSMGATA